MMVSKGVDSYPTLIDGHWVYLCTVNADNGRRFRAIVSPTCQWHQINDKAVQNETERLERRLGLRLNEDHDKGICDRFWWECRAYLAAIADDPNPPSAYNWFCDRHNGDWVTAAG